MKTKKQINEWVWVRLWRTKKLKRDINALGTEKMHKILKSLKDYGYKFEEENND